MDFERLLAELDDRIQKAVTNTTYTMSPPTRSIYAPENLDPKIKVVVPVTSPVRNLLPRVNGFGQVATWRKLTSALNPLAFGPGGQPTGTGTSMGFADAGQPNQTTQTYVLATAPYKNLGRDVEIGRQALASNRGGNLEDMREDQEMIKTIEVLQGEDNMLMNGSASVNPLEFDGFQAWFTTNSGTAVGYETASGIATYCRTVYMQGAENPQYFVANPRQGQALADNLQGTGSIQRIVVDEQGNATGGVRMDKIVNPVTGTLVQFVPSRYAQQWGYLLTVKDVTGQNWLEVEDLDPLSVYDVPTANHSLISRVYETSVLKVVAESFQMKTGAGSYSLT